MAMTARVKDELSRLHVTKPCCRKAEVSATLRFAGGLHIVGGRIVVEAELDTATAARRLRRDISEVFGHTSEIIVLAAGGLRRGSRYVVRVVAGRRGAGPPDRADRRSRAARSAGCRRRWSSRLASATPRRRGGGRSSRTARSPSRAGPPRSRSPAPARRPPWRWSAPPAGSASRPRPARCAASTGS